MATTPRVYEFDVSVDRERTVTSGLGGSPIGREDAWWAEHFVLAGLLRCTLSSLRHAAQRAELEVTAEGRAHGKVTKRESDGLYAFVEIEASFDVELAPAADAATVAEVLERAERGCFVGNSLAARPRYRWSVNGEAVE